MKTKVLIVLILFCAIEYSPAQSRKDSLIVFVGKIIEVKYAPEEKQEDPIDTVIIGTDTTYHRMVRIIMDSRYVAKYQVLQLVYGSYKKDTIEFVVYDHYGQPAFSMFETVLLFVSIYKDGLYHEKYQYFDVYKTVDNRWASPGDPYKFDSHHRKNLKPGKIEFKDPVFYDLTNYDKSRIKEVFPSAYFNIVGKKAFPLMGTYVEDLFTVKKEGVLKARGIF